jgi:hypothetical protein
LEARIGILSNTVVSFISAQDQEIAKLYCSKVHIMRNRKILQREFFKISAFKFAAKGKTRPKLRGQQTNRMIFWMMKTK